jgi:putative glutamine amidotransferase
MRIPLIGLTTFRTESKTGLNLAGVTEAYIQAVILAGAGPVLIPVGLQGAAQEALFSRLDGILFTGGGDIDPAFYGEPDHPKVDDVDLDRDRLEFDLLRRAVSAKMPFLGICRGLQLVNVGLGGTLYPDIADRVPGASRHDYYPSWPRDHLAHPVTVGEGSLLASILREKELPVNSRHHQAVAHLAPGALPSAYSPDGIVEALEIQDHPFGLAVQWHPECLTAHPPMRALFAAFVRAAGGRLAQGVMRERSY